uniref:Uncharacterized protein n=1 Tax=Candidatus Kentrum sp. FW TaxID=2126338 RepID=A0A450TBP0_9GAMM|nr:MAG: hypothetical protein BECKFW1821C_GA0114237_100550 [Candidatus Kentron sp. FW]
MLPVSTVGSGWRRHLSNLGMIFYSDIAKVRYTAAWEAEGVISGTVQGGLFGGSPPISGNKKIVTYPPKAKFPGSTGHFI